MNRQVKRRIRCQVVEVDEEATSCQKVGNDFLVDDTIESKLCARAQILVQAAADRMNADATPCSGSASFSVDVPCPDHNVLYRLSFINGEGTAISEQGPGGDG